MKWLTQKLSSAAHSTAANAVCDECPAAVASSAPCEIKLSIESIIITSKNCADDHTDLRCAVKDRHSRFLCARLYFINQIQHINKPLMIG